MALGPLNLGVRVRDRVAVLWGPVPSTEMARRAVELLQGLPDLVEVRNELHVEPRDEQPVAPPRRPERLPDVAPAPAPPGMLMHRGAEAGAGRPSPVGHPQWQPA